MGTSASDFICALFMGKEYGIGVTVYTVTINYCLSTTII